MKEQLIRYIDLLFAGAPQATDVKQEIQQNTLDKYDDLISQGKAPEAAYRLAISGIGDINEILGGDDTVENSAVLPEKANTAKKKAYRAIAIALYILCPVPLFILQDEIGLCCLLVFVAVATVLMILGGKSGSAVTSSTCAPNDVPLRKTIRSVVWSLAIAIYFLINFLTNTWYVTWVIFPLASAVQGLIFACMDLKEAK